jgi:hypothetical protein
VVRGLDPEHDSAEVRAVRAALVLGGHDPRGLTQAPVSTR